MNTARIIRKPNGMLRLELHGSGLVPVYHYDSNVATELEILTREIADWCERTPGEPRDFPESAPVSLDLARENGFPRL